ncbi:MAG: hypothetical protein MJ067_04780, partial [Oscillospiraceae bacterium]|nr:hypothetical protein [Oscillospiraceae bacterium]
SEFLLKRQYNRVFSCLADILSDKSNHPIMLCALLVGQLKSLYIIKLCEKERLSQKETMDKCGIKFSFAFDKLNQAARNISLDGAKELLQKCVQCDYAMKSSGGEPGELFAGFLAEAAVILG